VKYEAGHRSKNVEDARGDAPPRGGGTALKVGGGGAILLAIIAVIAKAAGVDIPGLDSAVQQQQQQTQAQSQAQGQSGPHVGQQGEDPDAQLFDFINFVVDDIQPTFARAFAKSGKQYRDAKLLVFREAVDTGCGVSSAAIGPFYCPPDEKAYIDLSFYKQLRADLGAPGDFAQAYVLAHEFGHHCQNLLGTDDMVRRETARDRRRESDLSVRTELQADCYAGIWAKDTAQRKLVEDGDIDEAIRAAGAIGDDRLQKMAGRQVNPETFTHGSSEQRVRWFRRGFDGGTLESCDTFAARDL
jgi:predicted metalloprotease